MANEDFNLALDDAQNSLLEFANGPATNAATIISTSFNKAGKDIASSLSQAARSGEFSIKSLVSTIVRDLQNIALKQFVTKPIENALGQLFSTIPQYGARASGGPVNVGGAYLVGENGPEYFVPHTSGAIENFSSSPININIHMAQGSQLSDVKRSASQISIALARAVERGRGRL